MPSIAASRQTASAFDYELPADRIAQEPLPQRDASRLLHLDADGTLGDHHVNELPALLRPGDLCVANHTRVRRARLAGRLDGGGSAEVLVIERLRDGTHLCLVRPSRRAGAGTRITFASGLVATVTGVSPQHPGARLLHFTGVDDVDAAIEHAGEPPVPPYIHQQLADADRYQTVFARGEPASAAAPTAGLHFTAALVERLQASGIGWATLRLDVGIATFAPLRMLGLDAQPMPAESYAIPESTAAAMADTHRRGGRVVAIGTTVVRALEAAAMSDGDVHATRGRTELFIMPGHRFRVVDGLLTNFHQPGSTLLVLLAAFAGTDRWRAAYEHALSAGYRFLSLGDCMLCWRHA